MTHLATQTVSSLWPMMGELGQLLTPSQRKAFGIECVTPERVTVLTGKTRVVIHRTAFEAVLEYLRTHDHHVGNRCVVTLLDLERALFMIGYDVRYPLPTASK